MTSPSGVDHVVLMKVKEDATNSQVERMIKEVSSLARIPGVVSVSVGKTFVESWMTDRRAGFTHVISVRLESKEALKVYQDHELHVNVRDNFMKPLLVEPPKAVDWESPLFRGT